MKKEPKKVKADNISTALQITLDKNDKLTKNQKLFNELTKTIEDLEKDIIATKVKMQKVLEFYSTNYRPALVETSQLKIRLAIAIGQTKDRIKYTKNQSEDIKDAVLYLCNDAFAEVEPNQEQEEFYDEWSKVSYKDELKEQEEEAKESISSFMESMFGVDINMKDFSSDAEGFAQLNQKFRSEFEKIKEKEESKQNKKKTKKQIEQEKNIKAEEEIKAKSIRSIYIMLVKILHPDSEIDPKLKLEKEEIMKKVTLAYDQKDLSTLLKLEMEWVHNETSHLEKISDDKLKIYIDALKEQVHQLIYERQSINMNPRFEEISEYVHLTEKKAIKAIKTQIKAVNEIKEEFNGLINEFEITKDKKDVMSFVKDYLKQMSEDDYFSDMESSFFF